MEDFFLTEGTGAPLIEERFTAVAKSRTFRRIVQGLSLSQKAVLDIGCGYGEYLSHFGPGSLGVTTTPAEVTYARKKGLNVVFGNAEQIDRIGVSGPFSAVWANNLFEHLLSPHAFLMRLRTMVAPGTILILGVPVLPRWPSLLKLKKFGGALASNHINFFTRETLSLTMERAGWRSKEVRSFKLGAVRIDRWFSVLAPHLYVVAELDAGFRYPPKKIKEWVGVDYYQELLNLGNGRFS